MSQIPSINNQLKPCSTFYPTHHKGNDIETFISMVSTEFRNINTITNFKPNLSKAEKKALKEFQGNEHIVIKKTWLNGGRGVIQDRKQYQEEAERILSDNNYYSLLQLDLSIDPIHPIISYIFTVSDSHLLHYKSSNQIVPPQSFTTRPH